MKFICLEEESIGEIYIDLYVYRKNPIYSMTRDSIDLYYHLKLEVQPTWKHGQKKRRES